MQHVHTHVCNFLCMNGMLQLVVPSAGELCVIKIQNKLVGKKIVIKVQLLIKMFVITNGLHLNVFFAVKSLY